MQTRWREQRRPPAKEVPGRDKKKRTVDDDDKRQEVREGRARAAGVGKDSPGHSPVLQGCCGQPRNVAPWTCQPRAGASASLKGAMAAELFAGTARWARAVASCGIPTEVWDIQHGAGADLLNKKNQQLILEKIRDRKYIALHLGIDCKTFTRARRPGGGPPPLRSNAYPWGFPDLTGANEKKVALSNRLVQFSIKCCRLATKRGIPWTIENPRTSILWKVPQVSSLMKWARAEEGKFDYCQFGMRWRKSTDFRGTLPGLSLASRRCCGAPRGLCARTLQPHWQLSGRDPQGTWWTKRAEPYPRALVNMLAKMVASHVLT